MSEATRLYEFYGVDVPKKPNKSGQYVATCPFCLQDDSTTGEGHFYISAKTGQFVCKVCQNKGNTYTFLRLFYEHCLSETKKNHWKRLSLKRKKFHQAAFEQARIAYSDSLNAWLYPTFDQKGSLTNLAKYNGQLYYAPGCKMHLTGINKLEVGGPIYLVEGPHDEVSLRWLLQQVYKNAPPDTPYSIMGVPSASTLPKEDLELLRNRDVYLLYDNDDAGRNGMKTHAATLNKLANSVHLIAWPENRFAEGYDIDDLIRESVVRPAQQWEEIKSWCFLYTEGTDPTAPAPHVVRHSFPQILKDFKDTQVHVYPALKDSLILTCAIAISPRVPGVPLWMYLIGDSGAGKSLVLESTLGSKLCLYRTSVTHKSFLSGFRDDGPDNSLLALLPGKSLIVKDWSNILSLPHVEQSQLIGLLREVYDGKITRSYGNNVYRDYSKCQFGLVAGVTKLIHTKSHAGLGERFLKFEIDRTEGDNLRAIHAALDDNADDHDRQMFRAAGMSSFLDKKIDRDKLPTVPQWYRNRVISLAQYIALCRTPVERTSGDLDYDPYPEAATRSAKQIQKISRCVAIVLGKNFCDQDVYRLVRKVAWDTSHGWRRRFYSVLAGEDYISATEITDAINFSAPTVSRVLKDMHALSVIKRAKNTPDGKGRPRQNWRLTDRARAIFTAAKLEDMA